jgi:5-methylthioadenosine/S-adenosylhomocysteine deaminase
MFRGMSQSPAADRFPPPTGRPDAFRIIAARWIAPVEPAATLLTDHAVILRGDTVDAVLPAAEAIARHPQAPRTDLPDHLLIPGLVNLHCHAAMALLRGAGDDLPLERWLRERIWPLEAKLVSDDFVYDGAVLACREMLCGGVTTFNDMYFFPEATARAALDIGMRAVVGILAFDFPSAYGSGPDDYLRKGLALRDALRHEPMIGFALAPHAPYTVSDGPLREIAKLAAELQLPVHTHVHETASEVAESVSKYGMRPLQRLAELGLVGPELIAVHAVHLDESDLRLLAGQRASVAHCPHSNLKLGSGLAPTARMRELGIQVGIGTDGAASNNRLDCLLEARTAALLAKGASGDASAWGAHATLEAATLAGARALGMDRHIGSIVAGKQADLVAVDLSDADLAPVFDPVSQLFHAAGREHVSHVWVAGRLVAHKRQLLEPRAADQFGQVLARIRLWHNRLVEFLPEP